MSDLFKKFSKAIDAFTDVILEETSSVPMVQLYRYDDFKTFFKAKKNENQAIKRCTISITRARQWEDMIFSENKYIIRMVMLDDKNEPLCIEGEIDEYIGTVIIASSIDKQMQEFMGDKEKRTVAIGGK